MTDAALVVTAGAYLFAVRRIRRGGARWPATNTAAFLSGTLLVFVAVGSVVAADDDTSFPDHVLQHLLLMMAAPALLALGRPVTLAVQAAPRRFQVVLVRALHTRAARWASGPAAWALFLVSMWAYFLTPWYRASLVDPVLHDLTHVFFLVSGYCYWQAVVGLDPSPDRPTFGARLARLVAGMSAEAGLGLVLIALPNPIDPRYSLSATRAGGQLFLMGCMVTTGAALVVVLVQWADAEERRARRLDARWKAAERVPSSGTRALAEKSVAFEHTARAPIGRDPIERPAEPVAPEAAPAGRSPDVGAEPALPG